MTRASWRERWQAKEMLRTFLPGGPPGKGCLDPVIWFLAGPT